MPFSHIHDWVFDLDNTLYPAQSDLFSQIDLRITDFVSRYLGLPFDEARKVQKDYYASYGTTLSGLMAVHDMEPAEYLHHVHEIDLSVLPDLPKLRAAIGALPGRRLVYTNGSRRHALRILEHMGLEEAFHGSFGIEDSDYKPKPHENSYRSFCGLHNVNPDSAIFFEDLSRNLVPAKAMGFTTVLVHSDKDWSHEPENARPAGPSDKAGDDAAPFIDYQTGNLTEFLNHALGTLGRKPLPYD